MGDPIQPGKDLPKNNEYLNFSAFMTNPNRFGPKPPNKGGMMALEIYKAPIFFQTFYEYYVPEDPKEFDNLIMQLFSYDTDADKNKPLDPQTQKRLLYHYNRYLLQKQKSKTRN